MKRLKGTKNYMYIGVRGVEITTAGALAGGWYKITGKASSSSGLPATSQIGDVVYATVSGAGIITLVLGDKVKLVSLTKVAFVTNVPSSAQKDKDEMTTQIDVAKTFSERDKPALSGSMDGYFIAPEVTADLSDQSQILADNIIGRFYRMVEDAGTGKAGIVYSDIKIGTIDFFLGRNETTTVGEYEIMEYLPSIIDGLTVDKPMEGPQNFNFTYTVQGSEMPCVYRHKIIV
jgi:hypothetical protein